jgi:MoaA/NifB/PqqE/SkfB family radical SAM enzyme
MYALENIAEDRVSFQEAVATRQPYKPVYVKIKLHYGCNLRCEMCKHWRDARSDPLPTERFYEALDELAGLGCRKVHFSGGEPLLRRGAPDLIAHAASLGMRVTLTTNGTLIDKGMAKRLVQSGLRGVNISIDSPLRKVHDRMRGMAGALKKSIRTVRYFRRYAHKGKLNIRINTVVSRLNYDTLASLPELAYELDADEINLIPVDDHCGEYLSLRWCDLERYNTQVAPFLAKRALNLGLISTVEQAYPFGRSPIDIKYSRHGEYALGWYQRYPCYAPWTHSLIDYNGLVYVCCMTREQIQPLGDLRQQSFSDIWSSEAYANIRRVMHPPGLAPCRRCDDFLSENRYLLTLFTEENDEG